MSGPTRRCPPPPWPVGLDVRAGRWNVIRMERLHAPGQSRRTDKPPSVLVVLAGPAEAVSGESQSRLRGGRRSPPGHPVFPLHPVGGDWFDLSESISPCVDVHSITRLVHFRHPCALAIHHVNPHPYGHQGCASCPTVTNGRWIYSDVPRRRCAGRFAAGR
jgi:hypothetical protein